MMTVAMLIQALHALPDDAEVVIDDGDAALHDERLTDVGASGTRVRTPVMFPHILQIELYPTDATNRRVIIHTENS